MSELELMHAAQKIVKDVIGVRQGDKVLVVTDEANIHLDGLMLGPTVIADNHKVLVKNGHLMI